MNVKIVNTSGVDIVIDPLNTGNSRDKVIVHHTASWSGVVCSAEYSKLRSQKGVTVSIIAGA